MHNVSTIFQTIGHLQCGLLELLFGRLLYFYWNCPQTFLPLNFAQIYSQGLRGQNLYDPRRYHPHPKTISHSQKIPQRHFRSAFPPSMMASSTFNRHEPHINAVIHNITAMIHWFCWFCWFWRFCWFCWHHSQYHTWYPHSACFLKI